MASEEDVKKAFAENLKAVDYHREIHAAFQDQKIYFEIGLTFLYDVFRSRRFQGKKLLDVGSGAIVHNIASASAYFPIIIQSDFVEDNRETLKRWLKNDSPLDWSEFMSIPARLEDYKSDVKEVIAKLESRIRNTVKGVVHCDFLSDNVINVDEIPTDAGPPYDLILAMLCLEVPCADFESFVKVLKRLSKLLRKGGGIVISSYLGMESWNVGQKIFHVLDIDLKDIVKALDIAGFGNHDVKSYSPILSKHSWKYTGYYCIASEKL